MNSWLGLGHECRQILDYLNRVRVYSSIFSVFRIVWFPLIKTKVGRVFAWYYYDPLCKTSHCFLAHLNNSSTDIIWLPHAWPWCLTPGVGCSSAVLAARCVVTLQVKISMSFGSFCWSISAVWELFCFAPMALIIFYDYNYHWFWLFSCLIFTGG